GAGPARWPLGRYDRDGEALVASALTPADVVLQSPRPDENVTAQRRGNRSSGGSMRRSGFPRIVFLLTLAVALTATMAPAQQAKPPVAVALVAAMSGGSALSGEAIKRGLTVAIDDIVDHFLAKHVTDKLGKKKPGIILENTPWGASNQEGLTKWFGQLGAQPVGFEKFNWGDPDMSPQLLRLRNGGADAIVLVATAPEGAPVVKSRAKIGCDVTTISL